MSGARIAIAKKKITMYADMTPVRSRLNRFQASRPGERLSEPLGFSDVSGIDPISSVTSSDAAAEGVGSVMVLHARWGQRHPQGAPYGLRRTFSTQFMQGQ